LQEKSRRRTKPERPQKKGEIIREGCARKWFKGMGQENVEHTPTEEKREK